MGEVKFMLTTSQSLRATFNKKLHHLENLKTYFKTSNFSLGLMSRDFDKLNQGSVLNLIDQSGDKLIHKIIHDNF